MSAGPRVARWRARRHACWWAFLLHRVSGLALVVFLPLHFWVLSLAIREDAAFDGFLAWTQQPSVELAEALDRLPAEVHLLLVEIGPTDHGAALSPAVARAVDHVVTKLRSVLAGGDVDVPR